METILQFVEAHAAHAHWLAFALLMLASLNFPVSEDLVIIASALVASTLMPENTLKIFMGVFFGAYLSDLMVYWIGRKWGPYLWRLRTFARLFPPKRMEQITYYYERHGLLTLLIGRFIPFGVRNCLFITAGLGKMSFKKFALVDGIACLTSNTTLFSLAYVCGKHLASWMKWINLGIFVLFLIALIGFVWYKRNKSVSTKC